MTILSVAADGWQAAYNGTPPTFTPDTSPENVVLTRIGWDATTIVSGTPLNNVSETFVINRRVRQLYPNQTSDITTSTAFSPANAVALSDYVYANDIISGVTNNSTEASPLPVAAWATLDRSVVGNSIGAGSGTEVELVAFHRNARAGTMVAGVVFRFTDGTTTITTAPVTATVVSTRTSDKNPLVVYRCPTTDITSLNAGLVTMNAKVYPFIGGTGSVLDSANQTAAREFSPRYFLKSATATTYVYVASTGSDSTGVASTTAATAAALPCLTVVGALIKANASAGKLDNVVVRIVDTVSAGGVSAGALTQNVAGAVITRAPGTARAAAIVQFGVVFRPKITGSITTMNGGTEGCLRWTDLTMQRTASVTSIGEAAAFLRWQFDDVDFDGGSFNTGFCSSAPVYMNGINVTNGAVSSLFAAATTSEVRINRGMSIDKGGGSNGVENWVTLASTFTRMGMAVTLVRDPTKGGIIFCCKFINPSSTVAASDIEANTAGDTITGVWIGQNLIEVTHATSSTPAMRLSSDTANHGNTTHCGFFHNTITGAGATGRNNIWYDNTIGEVRNHKLMFHKGDILSQLNTKGDVFSANAAQTGQMAYAHGVGCQGNFSYFQTLSSAFSNEMQAYPGLKSNIGTSTTVRNDPLFTNYLGTTGTNASPVQGAGSGAGGGTYTLQPSSPAKGIVLRGVLSHDLSGQPRLATNDTPGAFAPAPVVAPNDELVAVTFTQPTITFNAAGGAITPNDLLVGVFAQTVVVSFHPAPVTVAGNTLAVPVFLEAPTITFHAANVPVVSADPLMIGVTLDVATMTFVSAGSDVWTVHLNRASTIVVVTD